MRPVPMIRPGTREGGASCVSKTDMAAALIRELIITGELTTDEQLRIIGVERLGWGHDRARRLSRHAGPVRLGAAHGLAFGPCLPRGRTPVARMTWNVLSPLRRREAVRRSAGRRVSKCSYA